MRTCSKGALCGIVALLVPGTGFAQRLSGWEPGATGPMTAVVDAQQARVGNSALTGVLQLTPAPRWYRLEDKWQGRVLGGGAPLFRLRFSDGRTVNSTSWVLDGAPRTIGIPGRAGARRGVDRRNVKGVQISLRDPKTGLRGVWRLLGADGSAYLRADLTLTAGAHDANLTRVQLLDLPVTGARLAGTAPGSPVAAPGWTLGVEHPTASSELTPRRAQMGLDRRVPLRAGTSMTVSAAMVLAPEGQERRAFAAYLDAERARPYQPFLHYNSWYDIGYFDPYTQWDAQNRIAAYTEQLTRQRGVPVRSFLLDDGWDDTSTVWDFHKGFPQGFRPLKEQAREAGGAPGAWLSPWGGYGGPRDRRLATGRAAGMEVDAQGYALSGPRYFERFRQVCRELVDEHGVNHFKFDGTGSADKQTPGSAFDSDFAAAIALIEDLRTRRPDLFINLTTGTWPSPFWTRIADSIWRGGSDHSFAGTGTQRQQWITYRDADTYRGVVRPGPLYPLNALMTHGIIYAQHASGLNQDPESDLDDEIWSYFGSGTQLQELYITPAKMNPRDWDTLAAAARWSVRQAETLADVHWVGGDPGQGEVYGWAAWSPRSSVLTLRNPSGQAQSYSLDLTAALELPGKPKGNRTMTQVNGNRSFTFPLTTSRVIDLAPYEVLVLEGAGR